ncbi:MAG: DUF4184 family protein [Gammaproteobacteria bacterium]|nr:DUF4184 family protein [Gammaproteobacteria bacterium]
MPFTISHAAAVLLLRRWLRSGPALAAAVIGSMVPDFGLILPWQLARGATHGRMALLSFCLPLGLAVWLLHERLIRPALLEIAPDRWSARWQQRGAIPLRSWRTWLVVAAAVLGGAVTHLAWDGFTHEDARGVAMFPQLEDLAWHINGHPMYLYRILQHLSSVAGLALVLWLAWRWHRQLPPMTVGLRRTLRPQERWIWVAAYALLPAAACLLAALLTLRSAEPLWASSTSLAWVARTGLAAAALSLLLVSLLLQMRLRAGARR